MRGIHAELLEQGLEARLLRFGVAAAPAGIAARLGSGARALRTWERLYSLAGRPFAVSHVNLAVGGARVTEALVRRHPTYSIIESVLGLAIARADIAIRCQRADAALRKVLGLDAASPVMVFERVSYLADGRAAEHTSYFARAEGYEFALNVRGKMPITAAFKESGRDRGSAVAGEAAVYG
jgi:DNA-binding GntR family transcriptional regulator